MRADSLSLFRARQRVRLRAPPERRGGVDRLADKKERRFLRGL
jgi:hypothetical protein